MKSVAIIGAGLGGLAASVRLARQGFSVSVYDKNPDCGGRMDSIEQNSLKIDTGPTVLLMLHTLRELFDYAGEPIEKYLSFKKVEPNYMIFFGDGTSLRFSTSLDEMRPELERFEVNSFEKYKRFLADSEEVSSIVWREFLDKNFNSAFDMLRPGTLKVAFKGWLFDNMFSVASRYFSTEKLRYAFSFQGLYLGLSPHKCPGSATVINYAEGVEGVWFPRGGMKEIAHAMEALAKKLGVTFHYDAKVDEILVGRDGAQGVVVGGKTTKSDIVLCNADLAYAYKNLINPSHLKKSTIERLEKYECGCSAFVSTLVMRKKYSQLVHHNMFFPRSFPQMLDELFIKKVPPRDPFIYVCIPSLTDSTLEKEGLYAMFILVLVPPTGGAFDWGAVKDQYKDLVHNTLESRGLTGLSQNIVSQKLLTPEDYGRKYNLYRGATFGFGPTVMQCAYFRPHNKSQDLKNLYFAGANTHPFSGVPTAIKSGKLVAEQILSDYGP